MKSNLVIVCNIENSIKVLNDREREILYSRRLNDDPTTLEDLSKKYKISRERVRQIENKAFEKLQTPPKMVG